MKERRKLIVIIENDDSLRMALARLLAMLDHETESFASAEQFLSRAVAARPHCLLIDINLGDRSGLELARHPSVTGLLSPVIFMSSDDMHELQARALGHAFLQKPFAGHELLQAISLATGSTSGPAGRPPSTSP
jgi:FixJ family two-component response regulator